MDGLSSLIPPKYQWILALLMFLGSHADRAWRVVQAVGGIKGAWRTLVSGQTNLPDSQQNQNTK